jgi:ATP-dependent protease Clp ATPase subunit
MILLSRALAHVLNTPFVAAGPDALANDHLGVVEPSPLLYKLLTASDFDINLARGIVYVDDVDRPETQERLLRLWGEKIHVLHADLRLDLGNILFVCGGTFAGLDESDVGIDRHPEQPVTAQALKAIGMLPELLGQFGAIARVPPLEENTLKRLVGWVDFDRAGKEQD